MYINIMPVDFTSCSRQPKLNWVPDGTERTYLQPTRGRGMKLAAMVLFHTFDEDVEGFHEHLQ